MIHEDSKFCLLTSTMRTVRGASGNNDEADEVDDLDRFLSQTRQRVIDKTGYKG